MRGCAFDRKVISVFDETFDPLYGADLPGVCLDALGGAIACIRHAHAGARGECPCGCDGLRIVQFTDTHFGFDYDVGRFERAVEKINELDPHIVVFTGDLFEEYAKYPADEDGIIAALSAIHAPQGKYAVLGNHDYGRGAQDESIRVLEAGGFTVLRNESVELPLLGITVTGIDDCFFGSGQEFDLASLPSDTYNLVLCHEPDVFASSESSALDLMLSGHTNGGQVRLPFLGELILPAQGRLYPMGHYDSGMPVNRSFLSAVVLAHP